MMKLVVLCCVFAAATARVPFYFNPAAVSVSSPLGYALPLQQFYNYRGPLSLAPGQPANILAADGRPLDTLDVNLDRAAHITAKALEHGYHALKKRSLTRLSVVPGTAVGAGSILAPIGVSNSGIAASVATNPIGIYTQLAAGPFNANTPVVAGGSISATPIGIAGTVNPFIDAY